MLVSQKLAIAAHLHVLLRRKTGRVTDTEWMAENLDYAREIVLRRQSDGQVVQYGIVRINLGYLSAEVREEVGSEKTPLGRILIQHDVLRQIRLFSLWKIAPTVRLLDALELDQPREIYGRTALITCNDEPAIELLEIVK